jgi:hypothetical protein
MPIVNVAVIETIWILVVRDLSCSGARESIYVDVECHFSRASCEGIASEKKIIVEKTLIDPANLQKLIVCCCCL